MKCIAWLLVFSCAVLEYVEGKWVCEDTGPLCGLGEETARRYLRDIISGLMYLHAHVICQPSLLGAIADFEYPKKIKNKIEKEEKLYTH